MKKKIIVTIALALILACICMGCLATTNDVVYDNGIEGQSVVPAEGHYCMFNRIYSIVQTVSIIISVALIGTAIYKNIKVRVDIKKCVNDETKIKELNKKKKKVKTFLIIAIVVGIMFLILATLAGILKNFAAKPIIYIYPESETEVSVQLGNPEKITCSYPKYEEEWKVTASPNGDLVDLKTGRKLYSLYWEGINTNSSKMKEGFVVKGEDSAKFLEEKLEILGLNEREAEEFIIYWLPKLEKNNYNYIRFETLEEINENMPLNINPAPDTLIRVMMDFKALRNPIDVEPQELEKIERTGYTVVEWGGTEL